MSQLTNKTKVNTEHGLQKAVSRDFTRQNARIRKAENSLSELVASAKRIPVTKIGDINSDTILGKLEEQQLYFGKLNGVETFVIKINGTLKELVTNDI